MRLGLARAGPLTVVVMTTVALAAAGQNPTSGSINGTVFDNTGAVLPGATVTVGGPALMGVQSAVTNEQGLYRFPSLPPGTFKVTYELPGFATVVREGIVVSVGFSATVNVTMAVATLQETVTVSGASPIVDVQNTNVQNNFNAEILKSLPNARDIWSIITVTPCTMVSRFDVGGSTAGTQTGYSAYGVSSQVRVQPNRSGNTGRTTSRCSTFASSAGSRSASAASYRRSSMRSTSRTQTPRRRRTA